MVYLLARFIIYYRNGKTKSEDPTDPHAWDNVSKYEYICKDCSAVFPYYPEAELEMCLKCHSHGIQRQSTIIGMGIEFAPMPLTDEKNEPVLSSAGNPIRLKTLPHILKGSDVYNYGFFQDKPGDKNFGIRQGKFVDAGTRTHGIRIGMVLDPEGHCLCKVGYMSKGQPTTYTYYTTVHSLGFKEALFTLHQIKLEECGLRRVRTKDTKHFHSLDLGERVET